MKEYLSKQHFYSLSVKILVFGIIIFYGGLYILPDVSDMARIFYVLILLPVLYISTYQKRYFIKDNFFWMLMLLPVYLAISHLWADPENSTKTLFFHLKKVLYIYFFLLAVYFFVGYRHQHLRLLLQSLAVMGLCSAIISILCFLSKQCGITSGRLSAFSVQDINKAGAMYTVHMTLCVYFIAYGFFEDKRNGLLINVMLIVGFCVSAVAVYYAKTDATRYMLVLLLFFSLIPAWNKKYIGILLGIGLVAIVVFFALDGLELLIKDSSFRVRLAAANESITNMSKQWLFGVGLTHKLPVYNLPHPHNIFIDVFRFGGFIGLFALILPMIFLCYQGMIMADKSTLIKFCLAWYVGGIAIMAVYAQQPITRPGGYIWFLYWLPAAILAAELSRLKKDVGSNING